jgi:hypothetical protein
MGMLPNARQEDFCNLYVRGGKPKDAYITAGYSKGGADSGASALLKNPKIISRIAELKAQVAERTARNISFEAKSMFNDLVQDIADCKAAGDHKTAADLRKFLIRCFGYEDSPTLTHEKVLGEKIPVANHKPEGEETPETPAASSNVSVFADALLRIQRRK